MIRFLFMLACLLAASRCYYEILGTLFPDLTWRKKMDLLFTTGGMIGFMTLAWDYGS